MKNSVLKVNSHRYILKEYGIGPKGLVDRSHKKIHFVKGSKIAEDAAIGQDGITVQQLIDVSIQYLESVNIGNLANKETTFAIDDLKKALAWLEKRQKDRTERGVVQTYKK